MIFIFEVFFFKKPRDFKKQKKMVKNCADHTSQLYLMLFDSPFDVPSETWKNQRRGELKCEESLLDACS